MLFLVPIFFYVFSICALYDNVRSSMPNGVARIFVFRDLQKPTRFGGGG